MWIEIEDMLVAHRKIHIFFKVRALITQAIAEFCHKPSGHSSTIAYRGSNLFFIALARYGRPKMFWTFQNLSNEIK